MTGREFAKKAAEAKIERQASRMKGKVMAQLLLDMEAPEEIKAIIRAIEAARDVEDALHEALDASELACTDNIDIDNLKKWCFFLTTMTTQIKAFAENNPIVKEEKEE